MQIIAERDRLIELRIKFGVHGMHGKLTHKTPLPRTGPNSKKFSNSQTDWFTMVPTIYNADTLGIRPDIIGRPIESWTELLNPEFKGKASILNIASIGIMDAAMVCEAMGEVKYGDKGNMTKDEIDKTMAIFTEAKKNGQFRAFWKTFDESVNLMASGEVIIQSMWSPAITKVRSMGIPCVYQPLKEGYRSWGGGLGLARNLSGLELDAAYEYINWYLSGWVGGLLMRQGYYSAAPETSKTCSSDPPETSSSEHSIPSAVPLLALYPCPLSPPSNSSPL